MQMKRKNLQIGKVIYFNSEVSIFFVRAFIKLREMINTHQMLKKKIIEIEARLSGHDEQLTQMVQLLKQRLDPKPPPTKRRIGF